MIARCLLDSANRVLRRLLHPQTSAQMHTALKLNLLPSYV